MRPGPLDRLIAMIAITGGIAEGKSTVLDALAGLGYRTISADSVAREVYVLPETQQEISKIFEIENPTREEIREAISVKPRLRRELNALMHRPIWERILEEQPEFVELPLLVEACLHPWFQSVWAVSCGISEQRRRLLERVQDPNLVDQLLRTQLSSRAKAQFADRIVRTNGDRESVLAFVKSAAVADCAR